MFKEMKELRKLMREGVLKINAHILNVLEMDLDVYEEHDFDFRKFVKDMDETIDMIEPTFQEITGQTISRGFIVDSGTMYSGSPHLWMFKENMRNKNAPNKLMFKEAGMSNIEEMMRNYFIETIEFSNDEYSGKVNIYRFKIIVIEIIDDHIAVYLYKRIQKAAEQISSFVPVFFISYCNQLVGLHFEGIGERNILYNGIGVPLIHWIPIATFRIYTLKHTTTLNASNHRRSIRDISFMAFPNVAIINLRLNTSKTHVWLTKPLYEFFNLDRKDALHIRANDVSKAIAGCTLTQLELPSLIEYECNPSDLFYDKIFLIDFEYANEHGGEVVQLCNDFLKSIEEQESTGTKIILIPDRLALPSGRIVIPKKNLNDDDCKQEILNLLEKDYNYIYDINGRWIANQLSEAAPGIEWDQIRNTTYLLWIDCIKVVYFNGSIRYYHVKRKDFGFNIRDFNEMLKNIGIYELPGKWFPISSIEKEEINRQLDKDKEYDLAFFDLDKDQEVQPKQDVQEDTDSTKIVIVFPNGDKLKFVYKLPITHPDGYSSWLQNVREQISRTAYKCWNDIHDPEWIVNHIDTVIPATSIGLLNIEYSIEDHKYKIGSAKEYSYYPVKTDFNYEVFKWQMDLFKVTINDKWYKIFVEEDKNDDLVVTIPLKVKEESTTRSIILPSGSKFEYKVNCPEYFAGNWNDVLREALDDAIDRDFAKVNNIDWILNHIDKDTRFNDIDFDDLIDIRYDSIRGLIRLKYSDGEIKYASLINRDNQFNFGELKKLVEKYHIDGEDNAYMIWMHHGNRSGSNFEDYKRNNPDRFKKKKEVNTSHIGVDVIHLKSDMTIDNSRYDNRLLLGFNDKNIFTYFYRNNTKYEFTMERLEEFVDEVSKMMIAFHITKDISMRVAVVEDEKKEGYWRIDLSKSSL